MATIMDLCSEPGNSRPFKVRHVKRDGENITIGFLEPHCEMKSSRTPDAIEAVRKVIIDDERKQGALVYSAEYWIGNERIMRWELAK